MTKQAVSVVIHGYLDQWEVRVQFWPQSASPAVQSTRDGKRETLPAMSAGRRSLAYYLAYYIRILRTPAIIIVDGGGLGESG